MAKVIHATTTQHAEWDGPARYIRIVLHDSTEHLRVAAQRYRDGDWANAGGAFHPAPDRERYIAGEWVQTTDPHWAGVMRLSRDLLHTEVVTHECVHAALAIYRMDVMADVRLGSGCRDREETLAYIVGDLTAAVSDAIHKAGAWGAT